MTGGADLLTVTDAVKRFGAMAAVAGASFAVREGSITGLIGPNGAGKTTLFNAIAGEGPLTSGRVSFAGTDITGLPPHAISALGLARTFQIPRPFPAMTVLENVMLAGTGQAGERFWNTWFRPGLVARQERALRDRAREVIGFCNLSGVEGNLAGAISGGQKKLLELARALISDPRLILLDEPAAGVNPALLDVLVDKIVALNGRGMTFLIIEHNMDMVMSLCDPIVVLAQGRVIATGSPAEVSGNPAVIDAYLGEVQA
jgi:ABC-type branched-subunit amino acid transport system ATPase component